MASKRVTISVDEDLLKRVDGAAAEARISRSEQIARLIEDSLTPGGADSAFYLSTEIKGIGHDIMPTVAWWATPSETHRIDLDRRWVIRCYAEAKPGETPRGGMRIAGEGETTDKPIVSKRMK